MDVLVGWPGGDWQTTAKLAGTLVIGYLILLWLASILWAFRDIRARTLDPISQVVGVGLVTVFPLLGVALYLIVRPRETLAEAYDRQLEEAAIRSELQTVPTCPGCRRIAQREYVVCPYCRTTLREPCANCEQLLSLDWRHCPYCGTTRPTAIRRPEPTPTREPAREPAVNNTDGKPAVVAAARGVRRDQQARRRPREFTPEAPTLATSPPRGAADD